MPKFTIDNIMIDFPYDPYECQIEYMKSVIKSLNNKQNAILESPTGTGKTLCLLCAIIAWRNEYIKKFDEFSVKNVVSTFLGQAPSKATIIYCSRTHSQLTQVVKELKSTSYKPKVCVIGSRTQMCINDKLIEDSNKNNRILDMRCRAMVKKSLCPYYEPSKTLHDLDNRIMDIEDIVQFCKSKGACPYHYSRSDDIQSSCDIILLPYNYLVDPTIRKSLKIEWNNSIIIFDEAHNLESVCCDAASFDFKLSTIASIVDDLNQCKMKYEEEKEIYKSMDYDLVSEKTIDIIRTIMLKFEENINEIKLHNDKESLSGDYIFKIFSNIGITDQTCQVIIDTLQKTEETVNLINTKASAIGTFTEFIKIVFRENQNIKDVSKYYKLHIHKEKIKQKQQQTSLSFLRNSNNNNNLSIDETIVSYWCFSPGIAMNELIKLGIYNIILTSGTLSPLSSFVNSMQLPFPVQLENPHIINQRQIFLSVVKRDSNNISLNSSYDKRKDENYIKGLGESIISICNNVIGGVLIFFPSYAVMDECIRVWKNTNIYARLDNLNHVFVEPRGSDQFNLISAQYRNSIDTTQKGIMMGICRGKASEGMDYSNEYGRCVIITGIPFPPAYDPRVMLQKEFQDKYIPPNGIVRINGQEWYCQQASRAVNQAIGRVIRHKNDYGSILLLDERFGRDDQIGRLSAWLRPYLKQFENIKDCITPLTRFYRDLRINPPENDDDNNKNHINLEYEEDGEEGESQFKNNSNNNSKYNSKIKTSNSFSKTATKSAKPIISSSLFNMYKKMDSSSKSSFTSTESSHSISPHSSSTSTVFHSTDSHESFSNNSNSKESCSKKLTLMFNTYKPRKIEKKNDDTDSIKNFFIKSEIDNNDNSNHNKNHNKNGSINSFAGEMIAKMNEKIESSQFDDFDSQSTKSILKKPTKVISQVKPLKNVFGKNVRIKQYEEVNDNNSNNDNENITHYSIEDDDYEKDEMNNENEYDNNNFFSFSNGKNQSVVKPVMSFTVANNGNNNKKRKIAKPLEISNTPNKKKKVNTQITSFFQVREKTETQTPLMSFNNSNNFIDVDNDNDDIYSNNNNHNSFLVKRSPSMTTGTSPKPSNGINKVLTHDLITGKPIPPSLRPKLYPTSIDDSYDDVDIDTNEYKVNRYSDDSDIIQLLLKGVGDCPVCGSEKPLYYTNCLHGFCRSCWIQMSHSDNRCPVCRLQYVRQKTDYIVLFDDD